MITASTRLAAVLGDPVGHSLSPVLHNAAFKALDVDAVFVALEISPDRFAALVESLAAVGALGASVTVPHKRAALEICDRVSDEARRIGAVNCLAFDQGAVVGHNTDARGFADALLETLGDHPDGWHPLVLGGGGAARAVAVGLETVTAGPIPVVARNPEKIEWTEAIPWTAGELESRLPGTNLLIDCTAAGLSAETEAEFPAPIDLERLPLGAVVSTLVYHREPRLLTQARARGLAILDGSGMLVHQARRAIEIWTGLRINPAILWRALEKHRAATTRRRRGSSTPPPR